MLPKDGIGELNLQPNDSQINETAATCYGMNPEKLCQVLQMGVSFWATQMANESLMHKEAHKKTSEDLSDCKKKVKEILEVSHSVVRLQYFIDPFRRSRKCRKRLESKPYPNFPLCCAKDVGERKAAYFRFERRKECIEEDCQGFGETIRRKVKVRNFRTQTSPLG